ncbi:MAG: hypothetical protein LC793_17830 [Thermomicrobia bacterium]|nr:hypothetical protein [Thermomicrobia bacterium]
MQLIHTRLNRVGTLVAALALMLLPLFTAVLTIAPQSVAAAPPSTGTTVVGEPKHVNVRMTNTPPTLTADQRARLEAATTRSNRPTATEPVGPNATVKNGPPSVPSFAPKQGQNTTAVGPKKADDFVAFQNSPFGSAAPLGHRAQVPESDSAGTATTVLATGNWWAALTTTSGNSFSYINPYTEFPSINGGFCCDQRVLYDPVRGIIIWELQYITGADNNNTVRFAVATPANAALGSWYYYDINGTTAGYPTSPGVELDYPNMAIDNGNLIYTANTFFGGATSTSTGTAFRLPLDTLANHTSLTVGFLNAGFGMVPSQGFGSTIYIVRHMNTTQLGLYTWPDASSAPTGPVTLSHSAYVTSAHNCPSPDATDACARDDTRIKSVFQSFGILGVAWDVGQGTGGLGTFAKPYVHIAQYSLATNALLAEPVISDPNTAYAFPFFAPNGRGNIGGNIVFSGGTYYPSSALILADDFTSGANWNFLYARFGTNGPGILRWGDFTSVHPIGGNGNVFLAPTYTVQGGTCSTTSNGCDNVENRFFIFGRQRDNPFYGKEALPAIVRNGVFYERNALNSGNPDIAAPFGVGTDQPLMCDFDGNGTRTPTIYRNGAFYWSTSYDGSVFGGGVGFGTTGDIGLCGDWTGSGHDGIGIYRNGAFYLSNSATAPAVNFAFGFGTTGDIPIVGDWSGSGHDGIGIYRNGLFALSSSVSAPAVSYAFNFGGAAGDIPVTGDWNRTGSAKVGIYRGGGWYLSNSLPATSVDIIFGYGGAAGDKAVVWR